MKQWFKKWTKWEFWPFWFFYIPIYFVYLWYSLRLRSFVFFSAANPLMEMGGFVDYSKHNVLQHIHPDYIPKMILLKKGVSLDDGIKLLENSSIKPPFIIKPDKGQRGFEVSRIESMKEFTTYIQQHRMDLIIQEYIEYPLEFGIMYHRFPSEDKGYITSIVEKSFLFVTGDGQKTLKELIEKSSRAMMYKELLFAQHKESLKSVIKENEEFRLVHIGNHCKGTTFLNGNHLINPQLVDVFDKISLHIPGYFFGRYDIRVPSIDDLNQGKHIKIMELNGVNSEPAHIYDPHMPLFQAYRHMFKHWSVIFKISKQNHKKGIQYMPFRKAYKKFRQHFKNRKNEVLT